MRERERGRNGGGARAGEGGPGSVPRVEVSPSTARRLTHPAVALETDERVATIEARPGEPSEHLFRTLLGAYLGGARGFVVRGNPRLTPEARDVVRTFCRRTRQPEILSDEPNVIRLSDVASASSLPLPRSILRMGRLVVEFHRDAVASWTRLPLGGDGYWSRRDDEIDREAWYIQRLAAVRLGRGGGGDAFLGPWTVARSLERIADHAVILGEEGPRLADLREGGDPLTSLRQFHRQAMTHLEGALKADNGPMANDVLDVGEALLSSGRALSERLLPSVGGGSMPPATAAAVARVLESIGRTVAYAQDIAQVVLDRTLAVPEKPVGEVRLPTALVQA
ncbi:MAG: PhoU domain-containing protein [Thermoplasmata archaeon]